VIKALPLACLVILNGFSVIRKGIQNEMKEVHERLKVSKT